MEFLLSMIGFVELLLGGRALMALPKNWNQGKSPIRSWLLSGAVKGFLYTSIGMAIFLFVVFQDYTFLEAWLRALTSPGAIIGGMLGLVTSFYGMMKAPRKKGKKKKGKVREEEFPEIDKESTLGQIRITRIQIQEEIKRKEQEARRMMNDTYLREDAKAEILNRYGDCVRLLQELYTEASNILAYLETSGAEFRFDMNTLYVSESKQNDLQTRLDQLKAFRRLDASGGGDAAIEELMKKYDADFQKIRGEERQVRQG